MFKITRNRRAFRARSFTNKFRLHQKDINYCAENAPKFSWKETDIFTQRNSLWCYLRAKSLNPFDIVEPEYKIWEIRIIIRNFLTREKERWFTKRILIIICITLKYEAIIITLYIRIKR